MSAYLTTEELDDLCNWETDDLADGLFELANYDHDFEDDLPRTMLCKLPVESPPPPTSPLLQH